MTNSEKTSVVYGPVPSRRLGQSLGINNIPPKICSYSCIYCQVGRTLNIQSERKEFYKPEYILENTAKKVKDAGEKGEPVDYLAFVPDGEPTLDISLGRKIELLKPLGIKIAVITNASLIWRKDVQDDLHRADWVSLKIDAVTGDTWRKVNRPHKSLELNKILEGITEFSRIFNGKLNTETMLNRDINDNPEGIEKIADFIKELKGAKSYISIPTRPPAEKRVQPTTENIINSAYQLFKEKSINAEYLIGYEGNAFAFTGNAEEDLLSITSVHPMRKEAVEEFLKKAGESWCIIDKLISENKLTATQYEGSTFYMRKL